MQPDEIDFEHLKEMYGEVNSGRRSLRMTTSSVDSDAEVLYVSQYANTTHMASDAALRRTRVLLHKAERMEIWEEDLGEGRRLVTTVLLAPEDNA
jgi:hypothetical protein